MNRLLKRANFLSFAVFVVMMFACSKDDSTSMEPVDDPGLAGGSVLAQGVFTGNRNYQVSGSVKLVDRDGKKILRLEDFTSSSGPDLKVYLATDINASQFISLGRLRSVSGNQNYDISGMPNLSQYPFALIWCEQFGALFGSANLK